MRHLLKYALMGFLACQAFEAAAQPVTLKLSFFSSDTEVNYAKVIKPWLDAVNADPSGAVKIDAYPNGALGKALPAQPQLLLDGVADIAFVNPSLVPGRFPDDQVFELPGLLNDLNDGTIIAAFWYSAPADWLQLWPCTDLMNWDATDLTALGQHYLSCR